MCISAWEAYIEELARESILAMHGPVPRAGLARALNELLEDTLRHFNTPSAANVQSLLTRTVGVPDIRRAWFWPLMTRAQAAAALGQALALRHQIAHGAHPRPTVHNHYTSDLPNFFRLLGRRTDAAVRNRLIHAHGIPAPWPP